MRITIKALLKRKFNDRAKKQNEAAKAQSVETTKQKLDTLDKTTAQESKSTSGETNGEVVMPSEDTQNAVPTNLSMVQTQVCYYRSLSFKQIH